MLLMEDVIWISLMQPSWSFFFLSSLFLCFVFFLVCFFFSAPVPGILIWVTSVVYKVERVLCDATSVLFRHLVDWRWTPGGLCRWGGPRPGSRCEAAGQREKKCSTKKFCSEFFATHSHLPLEWSHSLIYWRYFSFGRSFGIIPICSVILYGFHSYL